MITLLQSFKFEIKIDTYRLYSKFKWENISTKYQ